MPVIAILDLTLTPGAPGLQVVHETLKATRAFDGCLGCDVLVDAADENHVAVYERWESLEADGAYRAWRATPEGASELGTVVAEPPRLTKYTVAAEV